MAVVAWFESIGDRSVQETIREAPIYNRKFMVRVDNPATSLKEISMAPGVQFGDVYPDDPTCYVISANTSAADDSMMLYSVEIQYGNSRDETVTGGAKAAAEAEANNQPNVPPPDPLQLPTRYWSGTSSLYTVNAQVDSQGSTIANTADTPIAGGAPMSRVGAGLTLNAFYDQKDYMKVSYLTQLVGCLNEEFWPDDKGGMGSEQYAWQLRSVNWNFKQQVSNEKILNYYEMVFDFQYKKPMPFDSTRMVLSTPSFNGITTEVPAFWPWLSSKGYSGMQNTAGVGAAFPDFQLRPIKLPVIYKNCDDEEIDPPKQDDTSTQCEWPTSELTPEPMALDIHGRPIKVESLALPDPAIVCVVNAAPTFKADFKETFGTPNPNDTTNP